VWGNVVDVNAPLVFIDTETVSLESADDVIWEVALMKADGNEHLWHLPVDLGRANAESLKIGRFYERSPQMIDRGRETDYLTPSRAFARDFSRLTADKYLVGAVPSFDEERLRKLLRANGACPSWSHRLICVEVLAAGAMKWSLPIGLTRTADALGIRVDETMQHTALGDARVAKAVFEHIIPPDPKKEES
jgi:Exonuclease